MEGAHERDFLEDVTEFFVEEEYFFLEHLVLVRGWQLTNASQEQVDVARRSRLDEVGEEGDWHVALLYYLSFDQRGRRRVAAPRE